MTLKKQTQLVILLAILSTATQAVSVGVVVTFPDGNTHAECITVPENANGYEVIMGTNLNLVWAGPSSFGHMLCRINGVGDDASGDYCEYSGGYWGFYLSSRGRWGYSPVGFDGGDNCWNGDWDSYDGHYCTKEGDVIGLAYGGYGTTPKYVSFNDICDRKPGQGGSGLFNMTVNMTNETRKNSPIDVSITDLKRNRTVKRATVIVYRNVAGTQRVYEGTTDENGTVEFTINKTGEYEMEMRVRDYNPVHMMINVLDATSTTTTSTTTTSTTTTSTTMPMDEDFPLPRMERSLPTQQTTTSQTTRETSTTAMQGSTTTTNPEDDALITGRVVDADVEKAQSKIGVIAFFSMAAGVLALAYKTRPRRG